MQELSATVEAQQMKLQVQQEEINTLKSLTKEDRLPDSLPLEDINEIQLKQNYPNPFDQSTTIEYYIPESINHATIYVYDLNGTQVHSINITTRGAGSVALGAGRFDPGMYFYALIADGQEVDTKRLILTDR